MPNSIHTYKDILETLKSIEVEDKKIRNEKTWCVVGGGSLGIIVVLILLQFSSLSLIELITSAGAAISLGPIFSFVYFSTQADLLSKRKEEFWQSLINNFGIDISSAFTNDSIKEEELRKVLMDKITEKINETLKYEY